MVSKGEVSSERLTFIGLGKMGAPMAANLAAQDHRLTIWNRSPAKYESLREMGATVAYSAKEAADEADVVITMVSGVDAVHDLLFQQGIASVMKPGAVFIDMSSIPPQSAIRFAEELRERNVSWLDAPVSGGTTGAQSGTLTILVGGDRAPFERCKPILTHLGTATHIGPAGAGQTAKLVNQIIVASAIAGVAEGLLLAGSAGIDSSVLHQALRGGFADSRVLSEHGRRIIERDFVAGGTVEQHLRDLDTAIDEAKDLGLQLPLTQNVADLFRNLALSKNDFDHSALFLELERINGLDAVGEDAGGAAEPVGAPDS